MEKPAISEQLKTHTRQVHLQLEQRLIPLIQSIATRSEYVDLLKIFYTFYAPLENRLATVAGIENLAADIQLRKADSLEKDITVLEDSTANLAFCSELPACNNVSRALGIMYVMEGSVLGGKVIANIITKNLATDTSLPFSFFLHYGNEAKIVWNQFKTRLDSTENLFKPDTLSAAVDTFVLFKNWIDKKRTSAFPFEMPQ